MPKAGELKKGNVIALDDQWLIVKDIDVRNPTSRGASTLYKVRFSRVHDKNKVEKTFTGDDFLKDIELRRVRVQYLYQEGDLYTFMDNADYEQYTLSADDIEDELPYLYDGLEGLLLIIVEDKVIGLELPGVVELEVIETAPAIKGASASSRNKPATLKTGLVIQVPEYLASGEMIKVNTATGKFMSRV